MSRTKNRRQENSEPLPRKKKKIYKKNKKNKILK